MIRLEASVGVAPAADRGVRATLESGGAAGAGLAGLFSWLMASRADRDLLWSRLSCRREGVFNPRLRK